MNWTVSADTRQTYEWNAYGGRPGTATHMHFSINDPDDDDEYAEYDTLIDGTCSFTPHLVGEVVPTGNHEIQLAFFCWKLIENEKVPWIACFNERSSLYDVTVRKAVKPDDSLFESVTIWRGLENSKWGEYGLFEVEVKAPAGKTITVTVPTTPPEIYELNEEDSGEYEYEDDVFGLVLPAALDTKYPQGNYVLHLYADANKRTLLEELIVVFDNGAGEALPFPEEYPMLTQPAPMNWTVSADTQQTYEWNAYGGRPDTATHMCFEISDPDEEDEEYAEYVALIDGKCSFTPHLAGQVVPTGDHELELSFFCWKVVENDKEPRIECVNERYSLYDVTVKVLNTVTFELGNIGWREGGGELTQKVEMGDDAVAPLVGVEEGYTFTGWDSSFENITEPTTIRAVYSYKQPLDAGWNLLSAKLNLTQGSLEPLLSKKAMTLGSNSKVYVSNENLTATQAYWVYCQNDDDEITLVGTAVVDDDFETGLKPGWNFVGPLYEHNLADTDATAWRWNGNKFDQTEILLAGHGYYLYWTDE